MQFFFNSLNLQKQEDLVFDVLRIIKISPFFLPKIPRWNKPFNLMISNAGDWGWISNINGYRYTREHPITKRVWPKIPNSFLILWNKFVKSPILPNSCLINFYENSRSSLGLHQDKSENNCTVPVMTISIGNSAVLNYGHTRNKKNLRKKKLDSGAIVVMANESRLIYHSIEGIINEENNILHKLSPLFFPENSRVSITLRYYSET